MLTVNIHKQLEGERGDFLLQAEFSIEKGSLLPVTGNSGSGKSSCLRAIAGLDNLVRGRILWGDTSWLDSAKNIRVPCAKRPVAMIWGDWSLFPHWNIERNLTEAGGGRRKPGVGERATRLLRLFGLSALTGSSVQHLSAGQRFRAGLAQMLMCEPELLLIDEGFGSLDEANRSMVLEVLIQLQKEAGFTCIIVSHLISGTVLEDVPRLHFEEGRGTMRIPDPSANIVDFNRKIRRA